MASDREILYFLQRIPGIGAKTIRELWQYFGTGERLYKAEEQELQNLLKPKQVKTFLQEREKEDPGSRLIKLEKKGIRYYSIFDREYPKRLRTVADGPLALFVRGHLPKEKEMTAAVVGARNHSYYGEKQTKLFAGLLAREGVGIVSGMARGIDSIAQETAIQNGCDTYAVLGCGVDICYPEENKRLFERIPEQGGIISEYLPGTEPRAGLFPLRNRIISALGDILLVMEAREKSGTLITVDMALEQGKEIWVLPGRVDDVLSCGCNRLIAQGAGILTGIPEFTKELELLKEKYGSREESQFMGMIDDRQKNDETGGITLNTFKPLSTTEKMILSILDYNPMSLNQIYEKLQQKGNHRLSIQEVSITLINLCVKRLAGQANGSWYMRV